MNSDDPAVETSSGEAPQQSASKGLAQSVRNLVFAGIGVVDVVVDGPYALYHCTIERGEHRVQRLRDRMPRGRRPRRIAGWLTGRGRRSRVASAEIEDALARLNVPTPADFDALAAQVAELETKIDALSTS